MNETERVEPLYELGQKVRDRVHGDEMRVTGIHTQLHGETAYHCERRAPDSHIVAAWLNEERLEADDA